jgi:nucleoside-diphosphate-sugar epimerase
MADSSPLVVVTGANGAVGAAVCRALVERSAQMRAVVRLAGSAPALDGVTEHVGDFADESLARAVTQGADAVVTTVHPMGSSREVQHRVAVEGTSVLARAARDAVVARLVHVSTAGAYDRSAGVGDVAEDGAFLPEGSGDDADTKKRHRRRAGAGRRAHDRAGPPAGDPGRRRHVGLEHAATAGGPRR